MPGSYVGSEFKLRPSLTQWPLYPLSHLSTSGHLFSVLSPLHPFSAVSLRRQAVLWTQYTAAPHKKPMLFCFKQPGFYQESLREETRPTPWPWAHPVAGGTKEMCVSKPLSLLHPLRTTRCPQGTGDSLADQTDQSCHLPELAW